MPVHGAALILERTFCGLIRAGAIIRFPGVAFFASERCCLPFAPRDWLRANTKQTQGLTMQTLSASKNNFAVPCVARGRRRLRVQAACTAWPRTGACFARHPPRDRHTCREPVSLEPDVRVKCDAVQCRLARSNVSRCLF